MRITTRHAILFFSCITTFTNALPRPKPSPFLGLPSLPGLPSLGGDSDSDNDSDDEGSSALLPSLPGLPDLPDLPALPPVVSINKNEETHQHDHLIPPISSPPPLPPQLPSPPPVNNFLHQEINNDIHVTENQRFGEGRHPGNLYLNHPEPIRTRLTSNYEEEEEKSTSGTFDDLAFEDGKHYERGYGRWRYHERKNHEHDDGKHVTLRISKKVDGCDDANGDNEKGVKSRGGCGYAYANAY